MIPFDLIPAQVTISGGVATALVGAQVVQIGFEAKLLRDVTVLKTESRLTSDD